MKSNPKKDKASENLSKVEESSTVYQSKGDLERENPNADWDKLPEVVQQLIEKGIKQCDDSQLIPHEKVMRDIKKRFNIS